MADQDRDHGRQAEAVARRHHDADALRRRYDTWLGAEAQVVAFEAPSSTGFSSETYLVDVQRPDGVAREVLRTTPSGATIFREYDLGLQVACMRNLADVVPTPPILAHVKDPDVLGKPFYVMEAVPGRIPDDNPPYTMIGWVKDAPFATQTAIYTGGMDAIGRLGTTDPSEVGLTEVLARPQLGATGLDQQLAWWRELYDWGREGTDQPTLDNAWEWLEAHRPDDPGRDRVVWGDARVSNMVFADDGSTAALLDWEMAGIGPAELDLGWFLWMDRQFTVVFDAPRLEGFPGEDALVARWAQATGHGPVSLDWFLTFAGVRFAITMMRIAIRTKADGQLPADSDVERNNLATRLLARHLDLPAPGPVGLMG